ncbi:MAG: MurR/RpiR family transcriptional regulator [Anaerolineales bacterium]
MTNLQTDSAFSYENRIREARSGFSPSFLRLANFLLDSYTESAFLTATELAHLIDIDPGTVVRFSQHLGYRGYPELQAEIRDRVRRECFLDLTTESNTPSEAAAKALDEVVQTLKAVQRSFPVELANKFISLLDEVERIILLTDEHAHPPANTLATYLEAAGYTVHCSNGSPAGLARAVAGARKRDLALAVCVCDETPFIAAALAGAKDAGARTVSLVAIPSAEAAVSADLVLSGFAHPDPGVGQIVLESMVYALIRMLAHARPARFRRAEERVQAMTERLVGNKTT